MSAATLADFRACVGVAPDAPLDRRAGEHGLDRVFVPGSLGGSDGYWWALASSDDALLACGWAAGDIVDATADIAVRLVQIRTSRCS